MKLIKFVVNSGGKFNPDKTGPAIIDFSKSKFIGATGDQGVGKSTLLELFLMACGQNGGDEVVEQMKNRDSGEINLELSFVGKDRANYDVRVKNGTITVKREGERVTGGPVAMLKQQLGVVGTSPMEIKNAPIEKIVKWLASYSPTSAEDFEKKMLKIKNGIKNYRKVRADANRSAKGAKEYLVGEGYVNDNGDLIEKEWLESEKTYKTEPKVKEVSAKLDAASIAADKYLRAEEKLKGHKFRRNLEDVRVSDLEKELAAAKETLKQTDKDIATGEKFLVENKADKTNYDVVKKEFEEISKKVVDYKKWQEIKAKKKEMDEFEDIAQKADSSEKALIKDQQELQWEVIPDIPGLEILLEDSFEEEGEQRKAGFYLKGFNSAQLSNTEWLTAVIQILKKNKVPVLVLDDISQFGSKLMETLEALVKGGCYVLYAEMSRGQESLEIQYQ